ncbi:MAG: hypothetical protein ACRC9T_08480 [Vibrionaceae bacterium]
MITGELSSYFLQDGLLTEEKATALMQGRFGAIRETSLQRLIVKMVQNQELRPAFAELKRLLDSAVKSDERHQTKARIVQQAILGYEQMATRMVGRSVDDPVAPQTRSQASFSHAHSAISTQAASHKKEIFKPIFDDESVTKLPAASYAHSSQALLAVIQRLNTTAKTAPQLQLDLASPRTHHFFLHLHAMLTTEFQHALFDEKEGLSNSERLLKLFAPEFDEQTACVQTLSASALSKSQLLKLLVATLQGYGAALHEPQRTDFLNQLTQILQQDMHSNAASLAPILLTDLLYGTKEQRELACRRVVSQKNTAQNAIAMLNVKRSITQLLQLFFNSYANSQTR